VWTVRLPYKFSSLTTTRRFAIFFVSASLNSQSSKSWPRRRRRRGGRARPRVAAWSRTARRGDAAAGRLWCGDANPGITAASSCCHALGRDDPDNLIRAAELELPLLDKLRLDETLLEIVRLRAKSLSGS